MDIIAILNAEEVQRVSAGKTIPEFQPGDTVVVNVKVKEGERSRVQAYEGVVIARTGGGLQESFTVRKISYGEGVERVFPVYSPNIDSIKVVRRGKVRRAKLYYLRDRRGKSARIAERVDTVAKAKNLAKAKQKAKGRQGHGRRVSPPYLRFGDRPGRPEAGLPGRLRPTPGGRIGGSRRPWTMDGFAGTPARSTTRSGTTTWSSAAATAPASSTSTATSSTR